MAQVKARQFCAVTEHPTHISDLAGVQILDARDGLKVFHAIKPRIGSRRAGISKQGVKDHFSDRRGPLFRIDRPTGIVAARVQVVGQG